MFRKDNLYDLVVLINCNTKKVIKNKGSAIFTPTIILIKLVDVLL